jgi:hypothetical protein
MVARLGLVTGEQIARDRSGRIAPHFKCREPQEVPSLVSLPVTF